MVKYRDTSKSIDLTRSRTLLTYPDHVQQTYLNPSWRRPESHSQLLLPHWTRSSRNQRRRKQEACRIRRNDVSLGMMSSHKSTTEISHNHKGRLVWRYQENVVFARARARTHTHTHTYTHTRTHTHTDARREGLSFSFWAHAELWPATIFLIPRLSSSDAFCIVTVLLRILLLLSFYYPVFRRCLCRWR